MSDLLENILGYAVSTVILVVLVTSFWMVFWILPISLNAESKCLAKGYPLSSVDWKGNAYCMNLSGTVTVKVDSLHD